MIEFLGNGVSSQQALVEKEEGTLPSMMKCKFAPISVVAAKIIRPLIICLFTVISNTRPEIVLLVISISVLALVLNFALAIRCAMTKSYVGKY